MILVSVPVPLTLIDKPKSKVKVSKKSQDFGYLLMAYSLISSLQFSSDEVCQHAGDKLQPVHQAEEEE